jgi:hypothetical protein
MTRAKLSPAHKNLNWMRWFLWFGLGLASCTEPTEAALPNPWLALRQGYLGMEGRATTPPAAHDPSPANQANATSVAHKASPPHPEASTASASADLTRSVR